VGRKTVIEYPTPSPEQLQVILPKLSLMEKFVADVKDVAKEMLVADPNAIENWSVTAGYESVSFTDDATPQQILDLLSPHGFTLEDLWQIASFKVTDLRAVIGNKLGLLEEESQKEALKGLLSPVLSTSWGGRQ